MDSTVEKSGMDFIADEIPWVVSTIIAVTTPLFSREKSIIMVSVLMIITSLFMRFFSKKGKKHQSKRVTHVARIFLLLNIVLAMVLFALVFSTISDSPSPQIPGWEKIVNAQPGEIVLFGEYRQSSDTDFKERIAWKVLAREDDKLLLLTQQCLDCQQYNMSGAPCTWESSSIRKWLREEFLSEAFTAAEQEKIIQTSVPVDYNPDYRGIYAGEGTVDQVFLLSIRELETYLFTPEQRKAFPTQYAQLQGAGHDHDIEGGPCWWWLRTQGMDNAHVTDVRSGGAINYEGYRVSSVTFAVRPAMWINIGAS